MICYTSAMHTYFVQGEPLTPIKIGKCVDPGKRLSQLQTGSPHTLRHLLLLRGDKEKEMHRRFKKDRIRGEWFRPSRDLLDFIKEKLENRWTKDSPDKLFAITSMVNLYCADRERITWNLWVASMHQIADEIVHASRHPRSGGKVCVDALDEKFLSAAQALKKQVCEIPWLEK